MPQTNRRVLIVGAGSSGAALAVLLRWAGYCVDIVEKTPEWNALGSGITLIFNALRVLDAIGAWTEVRQHCWRFDGPPKMIDTDGNTREGHGRAASPADGYPMAISMHRGDLCRILASAVEESGARARFGTTVAELTDEGDTVRVTLSDGSTGRYDLVVGADGVNSSIREMIGIQQRPQATGSGIWRVLTKRPPWLDQHEQIVGGPHAVVGAIPIGADRMYGYVIVPALSGPPDNPVLEILELTADHGKTWDFIRSQITSAAQVNYTWLDHFVVNAPWNRGRTVIIGDAAHCCPPTLAQGAAMGLEDAAVLAELLTDGAEIDQRLFDAFTERRLARVRPVVSTSMLVLDEHRNPQGRNVAAAVEATMAMLRDPA